MARKAALLGLVSLFALTTRLVSAGTPHLVQDINSFATPLSSRPTAIATLGPIGLFRAELRSTTPGMIRTGLAISDGTPASAATLKTFAGRGPVYGGMTVGTRAFFDVEEDATGDQLWVSDGTAAGTRLLTSFTPATFNAPLQLVAAFGTDLLFARHIDGAQHELYRSDGTAAGTKLIAPVTGYGSNSNTINLAVVGNKFYFVTTADDTHDAELWVSDGTAVGTQKVAAVSALDAHVSIGDLHAFRGGVLFGTYTNTYGGELAFLDSSGAVSVIDVAPGTASGILGGLAFIDGYAYFGGSSSGGSDCELWRTDGTLAGTSLVKDIAPGPTSGIDTGFGGFVQVGNRMIFAANDGSGLKLWGSDGTDAGTMALTPVIAFFPTDAFDRPFKTSSVKFKYITAYLPGSQATTIITDGTPAGTGLVPVTIGGNPTQLMAAAGDMTTEYVEIANVAAGGISNYGVYKFTPPSQFTSVYSTTRPNTFAYINGIGLGAFIYLNGKLLFDADDSIAGKELLATDETGTRLASDFSPESTTADASPSWLTDWNGKAVFTANDRVHGTELWTSDGTSAGTHLLVDINSAGGSGARVLSLWNGALYFFAYDGTAYHLMRMAAPDATPQALATVNPPVMFTDVTGQEPVYCYLPNAASLGNKLVFTARTPAAGTELWVTDGTAAGTSMVANLNTNTLLNGQQVGSQPCNLTAFQGRVYFSANTGSAVSAATLWSTDGTTAGTSQVAQFSAPSALVVYNNELYFRATDSTRTLGSETFKTNGTAAGTRALVAATSTGNKFDGVPVGVTNGKLILYSTNVSGDPPSGFTYTVWASDGTASAPAQLSATTLAGGVLTTAERVYFTNDAEGDEEPWISDGTPAGTHRLADLDSAGSSRPYRYLDFRGVVIVMTQDTTGSHLWRTDGTETGTVQLGTAPRPPGFFTYAATSQSLFFNGVDGLLGDELYVVPNDPPVAGADSGSATNGQAVTVSVLANDMDPDSSLDAASLKIAQAPAHGTTSVGSGGAITYTPTGDYSGSDTFTYTVADKQGNPSNAATVSLTVTAAPPSTGGGGGSGGGGGGPMGWWDALLLAALAAWRRVRFSHATALHGKIYPRL